MTFFYYKNSMDINFRYIIYKATTAQIHVYGFWVASEKIHDVLLFKIAVVIGWA